MYTCWREIIFTADEMILPPSWPEWTADAVRHGHALARARCISEEERVSLNSLAQTETHFQVNPQLPTNATEEADSDAASIATTPSISQCGSVAIASQPTNATEEANSEAASIATTPSVSRSGSATLAGHQL